MIEFEVGARPSKPLSIAVRDELDNPVNMMSYTGYKLEIRGTDDEEIDLSGIVVSALPDAVGVLSVTLPRDRSLFDKKGKYLLRLLLLTGDGVKDITRTAEIRVREFGRLN